jgi:hypothetical protein
MPKNKKADRIKFVKAVHEILKKENAIKQMPAYPVNWTTYEVNGNLSVTIWDESDHENVYSVFIRLLDDDKNYRANDFHDSPGDLETTIERFERHWDSVKNNV